MRFARALFRLCADPRLFTALGLALASVSAAGLVSSGTCVWFFSSGSTDCDDEFDDDCDDDDDVDRSDERTLKLPRPERGWQLAHYRSFSRVEEGRPQLARLFEIDGPTLRELKPYGRFGEDDLRAFCRHVLRANDALLGLPEERGFLVAADVVFQPEAIRVFFQQYEELREGAPFALAGRGLVFTLDPRGALVEIELATWLGPH